MQRYNIIAQFKQLCAKNEKSALYIVKERQSFLLKLIGKQKHFALNFNPFA